MTRADKVILFLLPVAAAAAAFLVASIPSAVPRAVSWLAIVFPLSLYLAFGSPHALSYIQTAAPRRGADLLRGPHGAWIALGAAAALWLPFEVKLFPKVMVLGPSGLDIVPVILLVLALFVYLAWWKLDRVGFDF